MKNPVVVFVFTLFCFASINYAQAERCEWLLQPTPVSTVEEKEDAYKLNVILGRISEEKFNKLHSSFRTSPTKPFDPKHSYNLTEFLPAFLTEVNGKSLEPHAVPVPKELMAEVVSFDSPVEPEAFVNANCHSVTCQWINYIQGVNSPHMIFTLADGDTLLSTLETEANLTEEQLEAGDILIVQGTSGLEQQNAALHSAIYLGDGLVFEKGNPGIEYPYRIARLDDVLSKYRRNIQDVTFHFKRPANFSQKIQSLVDAMGLGNQTQQADFGWTFANIPLDLKRKFGISAEFDRQQMVYNYLFIRLLNSAEAGRFLK